MAREAVLVVDDEDDILELVRYTLTRAGFRVDGVGSGEEALAVARAQHPALVVLDLMLPGIDGLDVCRRLKADPTTSDILVLMLTARGEEVDIVTGLEVGADDYLPKPFSPRVLTARVRALLRRLRPPLSEQPLLRRGPLVVDPGRHEASVDGVPVELTHTQFLLLQLLAQRPGWVYSRAQIVEAVRGDDCLSTERSVDVHIVGLRRQLGAYGAHIETVRGAGYRYRE
jgi:two-component system phosphate regulon response regulator PhoB